MPYTPKIENSISIGNILSFLALIGGGLLAFSDVKSDVRDNTAVLERLERIVVANTRNITDLRIGGSANLERDEAVKGQLVSLHDAFDKMEGRIERVMVSVRARLPAPNYGQDGR